MAVEGYNVRMDQNGGCVALGLAQIVQVNIDYVLFVLPVLVKSCQSKDDTHVISLKTDLPGRNDSLARAMSLTKRLGSLSSTV